jgi:putative PEP-CTERM system histidine kinase
MNFNTILSFIAAIVGLILAVFVLLKDRHSFVHRIFATGIIAFSLEAGLTGLSFQATSASELVYWQRLKLTIGSFLPGIWLIFALSFARANYREFLSKWKSILLASFIFPLVTTALFGNVFFVGKPTLDESFAVFIRLGWSGYAYYLFVLAGAVLILMNLERTLRASSGRIRWQIKYMVLGLGSLFGVRIYVVSQNVLFRSMNLDLEVLNIGALIVGGILILNSFFRSGLLNVNFYLSQSLLYNSLTVLLVGIYLLAVGVLADVATYFKSTLDIPFDAFLVFLALIVLAILLLSDRLRMRMKRIISRHFKRPLYDYQKEWAKFTQETTSLADIKDLCSIVTKMVSKTMDIHSVSIWVLDESQERVVLGGSTVFSEGGRAVLRCVENVVIEMIRMIRSEKVPIDFDYSKEGWTAGERGSIGDFSYRIRIRHCLPLVAREKFLGVMTLGDRMRGEDFSVEDLDLLKTIADQAAGSLLNVKLSAELRQAKEMETFQSMSAFFVHDLKNLASKLSLTMQNLPVHFNNPDFRNDALRTISESLSKINAMCSRLSSLSQKLELKRNEIDLNELVKRSLSGLDGCLKTSPVLDLHQVPRILVDQEQIQKVLSNLILNANEAIKDSGQITVTTVQQDGFVVLSVCDNGYGMSEEFIEHSLFRSFKTTKKQGMGIGLFQSKKIVEAHGGKVEVESKKGEGSTFRVFLPIKNM